MATKTDTKKKRGQPVKRAKAKTPKKKTAKKKHNTATPKPSKEIAEIMEAIPEDWGTLAERKILAVKLLPGSSCLTVTEKCAKAGVGGNSWYRVHGSKEFCARCVQAVREHKGKYAPEIFEQFARNAMHGGKAGMGDTTAQMAYLKDLAVMDGQEGEKTTVNVNIINQRREEKLKRGLERFGLTITVDDAGE